MTDARIGTAVLDITGDFSKVNAQAAAFGKRLGKTGKFGVGAAAGVAAVGAAAVAAGKALYNIGSEFDEAYDKIRVGTGKTGKQLGRLEKDFKNVVSSVPADFGDAAEAIAGLTSRLGLVGKPLRRESKQFLELSRITGTDLKGNISAVAKAFEDAAVPIGKQSEKLDELFRASQMSGASVAELAANMQKFGSPLRQLGIGFDQSLAMFAEFEKTGVNIQTMVPGLKFALKSFMESGKDPAKSLQQTFKGISNGTVEAEEAFKIFGGRATPDMIEAIEQGRFHFGAFEKQIIKGNDTIRGAGRGTMDASEKFKLLGNKLKVLVEPAAAAVFNAVGDLAAALSKVDFKQALKDAGPTLREIADIAKRVWTVIGPGVRGALKQAGEYFKNFARVIKGIIQVISGILSGDFGKAWQGVKNIFSGYVKTLLAIVRGITAPLRNVVGKIGDALGDGFSAAWDRIKGIFKDGLGAIEWVVDKILDVVELIPGVHIRGGDNKEVNSGLKGPVGTHRPVGKQRGGSILGGDPTGDSVPAMLERGEYVLNRKAVAAIGHDHLDAINFKAAPRFAGGGLAGLPGKAVGTVGDAIGNVANKGAGYFLDKLPKPNLPAPFSGLGPYVIGQVTDFIKDGFKSKKLGKISGLPVANGPIKKMAHEMVLQMWGPGEWGPFQSLEMSEAGWNPRAVNPSSGAAGLAQALPPSKYPAGAWPYKGIESAKLQLQWMMSYIKERYGSPSSAWAFHQGNNYYAKGGGVGDIKKLWSGVSSTGLQSGVKNVAAYVMDKFPGLSVSSTTGGTHAANSLHYSGQAVDLAGSDMDAAAGWIRSSGLYKALAEGIHNPNLSIADGKGVPSSYWGATTWGDHLDHIHLGVTKAWSAAQMGATAAGSQGRTKGQQAPAKAGVAPGYPIDLNFGPLPDTVKDCTAELHVRRTQLRQMEAAKKGGGDDKSLDKAITRLGNRIKALIRKRTQIIAKHHATVGRSIAARGMFGGLAKMLQGHETDFNSASEMAERIVALEPENLTDSYVGQERGAWGGVLDRLAGWRDKVVYSRNTADSMRQVFEGDIKKIEELKGTPAYKKQKWRLPSLRDAVKNAAAFVGDRSTDLEGFQGIGGPQTMLGSLGENSGYWLNLGGPGRTIFDTQDTIRQLGLKVGGGGTSETDSERASLLEQLLQQANQRTAVSESLYSTLRDFKGAYPYMGAFAKGGLALVGERGPELAHMPSGTRVHSANETRDMLNSGPPVIEQLIIHEDKRATMRYEGREFEVAVQRVQGTGRLTPGGTRT